MTFPTDRRPLPNRIVRGIFLVVVAVLLSLPVTTLAGAYHGAGGSVPSDDTTFVVTTSVVRGEAVPRAGQEPSRRDVATSQVIDIPRFGPLQVGTAADLGGILPALAVAAAAALAIVLMFIGILRLIEAESSPATRLDVQAMPRQQGGQGTSEDGGLSNVIDRLDQRFSEREFSDDLSRQLMQADLRMTVSEYLLMRAALVLVAFLLGALGTRNPGAGVLFAIAAFFLPPFYVRHRRNKRLEAFNKQLEDILTLLVGSLRAGYSFLHALNVIVDEIPPPASDEFRRVVREVGLGLSLQEALSNLVDRVESEDLDMIVTAVNIQQEVGGNLATILDVISETIRERVRIEGEIRVLTSRQKITGYILALLPFSLGGILYLMNPQYMSRLFEPGPILLLPAGATVLIFIGFLIIRKIVDIEV